MACGNFSDTSGLKTSKTKGSRGHALAVHIRTENRNQTGFYPCVLRKVSVLTEPILGHPRYLLTDVPPQPNSPSGTFSHLVPGDRGLYGCPPDVSDRLMPEIGPKAQATQQDKQNNVKSGGISSSGRPSRLCYTSRIIMPYQTRVKLNRVFFPR